MLDRRTEIGALVAMIPNGVDYGWFADPCPEPEDLFGVGRPRIG